MNGQAVDWVGGLAEWVWVGRWEGGRVHGWLGRRVGWMVFGVHGTRGVEVEVRWGVGEDWYVDGWVASRREV